jgi:hypothetical protein
VNDSSDGDGDGALEAREFAALDITIVNEGTSFMAGLEATVEMPEASPFLSFIDTTARIANLDPGASASSADSGDSFTLEIAEGCDSDFIVPLVAVVRDGSAHAFSLPFDLEVKCATGGTPKPVMDPDAGMSGGPMQNENDAGIVDREPLATDDSGCTSTHAAGGSAGVSLLLAIGALIVLRSRTR